MIPSRYQLWGWAALAAGELLLALLDMPLMYAWGLLLLWLAALAASAWTAWREEPRFALSRDYNSVQQSGKTFEMQLSVHNQLARDIALQVFDHYPATAETDIEAISVAIAAQDKAHLRYSLCIQARGRFEFSQVQLRYLGKGPLPLWQRDVHLPCAAQVRMYPRFVHLHQQRFASIHSSQLGNVHPLHIRSGNGDFSHLRDYLAGDAIARLDHKARARLGKWLVREFEFEHEQPVLLMVDNSRRLQSHFAGHSLFDEVLAAATQLAHAALAAGDEIGMQLFADTPLYYLPCSRQSGQYRRLVESLFDCYPQAAPPDFAAAIREVYLRQRRRSLIILLTVLEAGDEHILRPALQLLQKRHHVMLISIRPPYFDEAEDIARGDDALIAAARDVYAAQWRQTAEKLKQNKLIFIDSTAKQLRPQLLNAYIAYKNRLKR